MTERIVDIPREGVWETPEGWRVLEFYYTPGFMNSNTNRPTSARITNELASLEVPPEMCGQTYRGSICGFSVHKGRHSWEPEDPEDYAKQTIDYCNRMAEAVNLGPEDVPESFWAREGKPAGEVHASYYITESDMTPWDVVRAFGLDYWRGSAVTHTLRAGRKPGVSEIEDLRKAYTFLGERVRDLERETIEVDEQPTQAPEPTFYCRACGTDVPVSELRRHD